MSEQPQRPPSLVMRQGSQPNQIFPLHQDVMTMGRAVDNDIVIDDSEVSRHHARLTRRGNDWILEDLGSRNGTFVNGQRITGPETLTPGSQVGLGPDVLLSIEGEAPAKAPPEPEKPTPVPAPPPTATAPKPKGRLPGWACAVMVGLVLLAVVVVAAVVVALLWVNGGPDDAEIIKTIPTFTPVVVVTAPPTNTPLSAVEPTPTPPPVESELTQFEDTGGVFKLRYPATLSQIAPPPSQGTIATLSQTQPTQRPSWSPLEFWQTLPSPMVNGRPLLTALHPNCSRCLPIQSNSSGRSAGREAIPSHRLWNPKRQGSGE